MLLGVKKYSEKLLLPLGKKIKKIPANVITALGLIFAVLAFFFLFFHLLYFYSKGFSRGSEKYLTSWLNLFNRERDILIS